MKSKILLVGFIILAVVFVFTGCQKITQATQADVIKQYNRYWVIFEKMHEGRNPGQENWKKNEIIAKQKIAEGYTEEHANQVDWEVNELILEIEETLRSEFDFVEKDRLIPWDIKTTDIEDTYRFAKRQNELMEQALVKIKGIRTLWKIRGKYVPDDPNFYNSNPPAAGAKSLVPENKINVASSDVTVVEIDKVSKIAPEDNIAVEDNTVEQPMVSLSIFNGNGIEGNANKVSKILEVKYKILEVGNAVRFDYPETEIRLYTNEPYGGDARKAANDIKVMLRNKTTISEPIIIRYPARNIDSDIIIVLGADCK